MQVSYYFIKPSCKYNRYNILLDTQTQHEVRFHGINSSVRWLKTQVTTKRKVVPDVEQIKLSQC